MEEVGVTTGYVRDSPHHPGRRRQRGEQPRAVPNEQSQNVSSTNNGSAGTTTQPTQNGVAEREGAIQEPDNLTVEVGGVPVRLGDVAPVWIPDTEAASCMQCGSKFTFRKRRHHCRACGKVFCATCCNVRVKLKYMKTREARVCATCLNAILTAEAMQRVSDAIQSNENSPENNGTENTTGGQPQEDMTEEDFLTPQSKGVDRSEAAEQRCIVVTKTLLLSLYRCNLRDRTEGNRMGPTLAIRNPEWRGAQRRRLSRQRGSKSFIPESEGVFHPDFFHCHLEISERWKIPKLTKLWLKLRVSVQLNCVYIPAIGDCVVCDRDTAMKDLTDEAADPVIFLLSKVLQVHVKIVHLNCCVNRICWCFTTKGLAAVGQDEIVFVLECLPEERSVPRDMLLHIYKLYQSAVKGEPQYIIATKYRYKIMFSGQQGACRIPVLKPNVPVPTEADPPRAAVLVWDITPKVGVTLGENIPLRLMLRLGAEFRYYPCPLMSVRFRKPVFQEIGHTIMNLLADFKNYQYMLPLIRGVVVHMQDHETIIHLPKNRYDDVMKVINNSNEHVMAIAANFSPEADSHLVCIQNDHGVYQTQAINRQNKPRKVTGASFMVLRSFKSNSGLTAKSSIVEDGLMVQIRPDMMAALRDTLRNMADFTIPCGAVDVPHPDETVILRWVDDDTSFNSGVKSPVDNRPLEGIESIRIQNTTDFQGHNKIIRWTEVFFIENGGSGDSVSKRHIPEPVDLSRLAENLAIAFCLALSESLQDLITLGLNKLGLRVTVDLEKVGYEVGSRGNPLPDQYMNNLDDLLIPVLHNAVSQQEGGPVVWSYL
ncbi:hypothetical protein BSL78_03312 [Apostichopus japonicus]|uniref:FYVE-type domain-containing protein n=1 Tax=Stichopus japonicus TaxID=307972 RepID=A0A2G8LHT0_STIJA|nr:hypothetical protein BSL78_03312 [Apostichopus japonicus]